jgi:hypothetical protein
MDQAKGFYGSEGTNYIVGLDFSPVYIKKYLFISNSTPDRFKNLSGSFFEIC